MPDPAEDFSWFVRHTLTVRHFARPLEDVSNVLALPMHDGGRAGVDRYKVDAWSHTWYEGAGDTAWLNSGKHRAALDALLAHLIAREPHITETLGHAEICITTRLDVESWNPGYFLSASTAQMLGRLNIGWRLSIWPTRRA